MDKKEMEKIDDFLNWFASISLINVAIYKTLTEEQKNRVKAHIDLSEKVSQLVTDPSQTVPFDLREASKIAKGIINGADDTLGL